MNFTQTMISLITVE